MKFITAIISTALLAFITGIYFPWWSIAAAAFIIAVIFKQSAGKSFVAGFLGVFIFWFGFAFLISMQNQNLLSEKIAALMGIGNHSFLLMLTTGIIGGIVAGFAALSANLIVLKKSSI